MNMAPFESDQDLTNVPSFIELIQSTQAHTKCLDISLSVRSFRARLLPVSLASRCLTSLRNARSLSPMAASIGAYWWGRESVARRN